MKKKKLLKVGALKIRPPVTFEKFKFLFGRRLKTRKRTMMLPSCQYSTVDSRNQEVGRIGDFIVTITYDSNNRIVSEDWEPIPGTNARRASIHDSFYAWATEYNAFQDLRR